MMAANPRYESIGRRWLRRAITIPGVFASAALYAALLAPCLLLAALSDGVQRVRGRRSGHARALLAVATLLAAESWGLLALGLAWLVSLGRPQALERLTFRVQRAWAAFLFGGLRRIYGLRVLVEGSDDVSRAPFVVFARHTSIFDTLVPIITISIPYGTRLRYVMKRELLWDPCLDVAGNRLTNRFVARGSSDPATQVRMVAELGEGLSNDSAVVIYPEGTRYSPAKHAAAVEKLGRNSPGLAALGQTMRRVLPPKPGGPLALLSQGHDVVFMAHSGFDGITGWRDVWRGDLIGRTVRIRFTRYAASGIPVEPDQRARWLFERWVELDRWVQQNEVSRESS